MPLYRPNTGGGITIGTTVITGGTQGSILFIGAGLVAQQDNPNLFFDDTNNRVGIGTAASPHFRLDVGGDIRIRTTSALYFGGTGAADNDVNLYRSAADTLKTDDNFVVASSLYVSSLSNTAIPYIAAGGLVSNDISYMHYDATNHRLGLGTNGAVLSAMLTVRGSATSDAFTVQSSTPTALMNIKNDGTFFLGKGGSATSDQAVTIGYSAITNAAGQIAIGYLCQPSGTNAIGIGNAAAPGAADAIAIGRSSSAAAADSIAIGRSANSVATQNVVIGATAACTSGQNVVVLGYGSTSAAGQNTIVGSNSSNSSGTNNIVIGYSSSVTSGNTHVIIGNDISASNGANDVVMIGRYNRQVNDGAITIVMDVAARTNRCGAGDTIIGAYTHGSSDVGSSGYNTMIGYNQQFNWGGNFSNLVMIGRNVKCKMDTSAGYSNAIGSFTQIGNGAAAVTEGCMVFGSGDGTNYLTNIENSSLIIGFKDQYESFKLYKRGVFVFNGANAASVVDGTNCDASCTNTLVFANGTAPAGGKADSVHVYCKDLTAGNTMLGIYTEGTPVGNGTPVQDRTIAMEVNGTTYYILASTVAV